LKYILKIYDKSALAKFIQGEQRIFIDLNFSLTACGRLGLGGELGNSLESRNGFLRVYFFVEY
jgi:hypothetical protein